MVKEIIKRIPGAHALYRLMVPAPADEPRKPFPGSADYWEQRYKGGGDSGVGSYDFLAEFKADVLNGFVRDNDIRSVIEFGCGDGNQLRLADYPDYIGVDVSRTAVEMCESVFADDDSKRFMLTDEYQNEQAELALSLDVLYHLVEDAVYEEYMRTLFESATRFVIIYSSNTDDNEGYEGTHVWHRTFTAWVEANAPDFALKRRIPNRHPYQGDYRTGSFSDFYIFGLPTA